MKDLLRKVRLEARTGRPFTLELWETDQRDRRNNGRNLLGYRLTGPEGVVFEGEDFGSSPLSAEDSDDTLRTLLGFLTLRPGDTDDDYFKDYTPEQRAFCDTDAEALSLYADEESTEPFADEEVSP